MKSRTIIASLLLGASVASAEVLTFSSAYALALEHSNEIKSLEYSAMAEEEKIDQEKSGYLPQVNLSSYYRKSEYKVNPSKNKIKQGLINYTATLRQSIYNKEVYSRVDAQEARSRYSSVRVEKEKEALAQKVFKSYLDVLKSQNRINLLRSHLEYTDSRLADIIARYDIHMANKMDLFGMRVEMASAKIELDKELKLFKVYELKLKNYLGDVEYELPNISSDKILLDVLDQMRGQTLKDADLDSSLMVKEYEAAYEISKEDIKSAISLHYPSLNFDASYSYYDTDTPTTDAPYDSTSFAMVSLNIPIYSGGYASSRVESAKLSSKSAFEDLEHIKKSVGESHSEYKATFEASATSVEMYKEAIESAKLYLDAMTQGYEHGLKSLIDLNDAKSKLDEVRYKYIENLYEMVDSYIGILILSNNFDKLDLLDKLVE